MRCPTATLSSSMSDMYVRSFPKVLSTLNRRVVSNNLSASMRALA